jgi:spore coat polysaccharide biosynthesis protein SpsF
MNSKKVVATIECRMGSTRLPGKVLKEIKGKPELEIFYERVKPSKHLNDIVIATTTSPRDDVLANFANDRNINLYRGSEDDVLDRVLNAAKSKDADVIVELIPDNPLMHYKIVDEVVDYYLNNEYDYISTFVPKITFPTGIGVQVFSTKVLDEVDRLTRDPQDPEYKKNRENVTWYIYHHLERYRINNYEAKGILKNTGLRLDLDNPEDFALITKLYENFNSFMFTVEEAVEFLLKNPEVANLNAKYRYKDDHYK